MFTVADFQELRRDIPAEVLSRLMVQLVSPDMDEDDEEQPDPKPMSNNLKKTKD